VVVGADQAGNHDLAAAVDDSGGSRVAPDDGFAGSHVDDAGALDVDSARIEDAPCRIDREDGGVADEEAHGVSPCMAPILAQLPAV
jgi:hypothetical protein